jgi:NAD(P)-dependent dehydrogenase (short-subunit alcohol dehydrogenase family)
MRELAGKTAVVTGAGSGIGLGLARSFARQGMAVVLCDIRGDRLDGALAEVRALGARAIAVATDVSDRAAVEHAAREAQRAFGAIHVACNNAGVAIHGKSVAELTAQEWDWIIGVNLYGVIHGIQAFLPLIRAHGGEGHIVNTASIAGFQVRPGRRSGGYAATKYAVVALSESLAQDLADGPIGVSVLAPAAVNTRIYLSAENRPARFGGPLGAFSGKVDFRFSAENATTQEASLAEDDPLHEQLKRGLHPDMVGERVVRAIRQRELFVFTHLETKAWLDARHQRIVDAYGDCARWLAERK